MEPTAIAGWFSGPDGKDRAAEYLRTEGVFDLLNPGTSDEERIPPDYRDLARLHVVIRRYKVFTVLEFGLGFSTVVMADALRKNSQDWSELPTKPRIRHSNLWKLHSVDTSAVWADRTATMLPEHLRAVVSIHSSTVTAGTFQGRACHYYDQLPDVVPDLIYLDGPDPADVKGSLGGLSWNAPDRVVTAADILRMEPQLLPGTVVLVDGRTANVRFLAAHLYRKWAVGHDADGDVSVLFLDEPPLGRINAGTLDFRFGGTKSKNQNGIL